MRSISGKARRPFDLEGVASELLEIEVCFERERMNDLAALLPHRGKGDERSVGDKTCFFGEFAPCGGGMIAVRVHKPLGD